MGALRIGCSGWQYDSWRGRLYPEREPKRRWLELYAQTFDTVEVNSTFYRLARRSAVEGWVAQTPPGFMFAVKASRYLTHIKRLTGLGDGVKRFYEPLAPLIEAQRLGPVLWQLPENFHRDDERLARVRWQRSRAGRTRIEFRHESWFAPQVLDAAARRPTSRSTIGDHPERPFQSDAATADWRFVRFHYGHRGRRGNYSNASCRRGPSGSRGGDGAPRCGRTSTTTGRGSRRRTQPGCGLDPVDRLRNTATRTALRSGR